MMPHFPEYLGSAVKGHFHPRMSITQKVSIMATPTWSTAINCPRYQLGYFEIRIEYGVTAAIFTTFSDRTCLSETIKDSSYQNVNRLKDELETVAGTSLVYIRLGVRVDFFFFFLETIRKGNVVSSSLPSAKSLVYFEKIRTNFEMFDLWTLEGGFCIVKS